MRSYPKGRAIANNAIPHSGIFSPPPQKTRLQEGLRRAGHHVSPIPTPPATSGPTGTKQGHYNSAIRLRCVTEPDEAQKVPLHLLGITLPQRLRRIDEIVQM
jgi:hypothetical protein